MPNVKQQAAGRERSENGISTSSCSVSYSAYSTQHSTEGEPRNTRKTRKTLSLPFVSFVYFVGSSSVIKNELPAVQQGPEGVDQGGFHVASGAEDRFEIGPFIRRRPAAEGCD